MDKPKTINEYQDQICKVLKCPPDQKYRPDVPTMNFMAPLWAVAWELNRIVDRLEDISLNAWDGKGTSSR